MPVDTSLPPHVPETVATAQDGVCGGVRSGMHGGATPESVRVARPLRMCPAREADRPALCALQTASWCHAYADVLPSGAVDDPLASLMAWTWRVLPTGVTCAWLGDGPAQRLAGFVRLDRRQGWPYIDNLHVAPAFHRLGIGRALMLAATGALGAAGEGRVWLTVVEQNRPARAFYRAAGGVEGAPMRERLVGAPVVTRPVMWLRLGDLRRACLAPGAGPLRRHETGAYVVGDA